MAEKLEDLSLPNSVIMRLLKDALPEGINISKDARSTFAKAASIFVLYTTSCASAVATKSHRKTVSGSDVFQALNEMEFDHYIEPLTKCLEHYRAEKKKDIPNGSTRTKKRKSSVDVTNNNLDAESSPTKSNNQAIDSLMVEDQELNCSSIDISTTESSLEVHSPNKNGKLSQQLDGRQNQDIENLEV